MKWMSRLVLPFGLATLGLIPGLACASTPDLRTSNAALIRHIKATDYVFQALLGTCKAESVQRSRKGGSWLFTYRATCSIRPLPHQDCQSYRVTASGTVDTPEWATVRDVHLHLLCSA